MSIFLVESGEIRSIRDMRVLAALLATAVVSSVSIAIAVADVGPPPSCPPGQHDEYLYGHHCVPEGSHLEEGPGGEVNIVPDAVPTAQPTPAPDAPTNEFASPPPPASEPSNATATPPPQRGCACSIPGVTGRNVGFGFAAAAAIFAAVRRLRTRRNQRPMR